jgi:hypothetical protein
MASPTGKTVESPWGHPIEPFAHPVEPISRFTKGNSLADTAGREQDSAEVAEERDLVRHAQAALLATAGEEDYQLCVRWLRGESFRSIAGNHPRSAEVCRRRVRKAFAEAAKQFLDTP